MVGGYGRGNRYRWWYRATGLPGWMRFGMLPPWNPWFTPWGMPPWYPEEIPPEEELRMLEEERQMLEDELEEIKKRIDELKRELGR